MENPSLRVSGHGSSTSRTFIVEHFSEDECGLWAIDEATGKQGFIDDEQIKRIAKPLMKSGYGDYLMKLL